MGIDDLVVWTRKKLGMIDEESAEEWRLAKQEEKEKKRLLRKIAKKNSHVATLYKDKPKEVLEKVAASRFSSWEESEPILAVIASEPVEDQAKVALILSENARFTNYVGISEEELVKDLPVSAQIARLGGCEPVVFKVIGDAYDTNNYTAFNRRYNYGPLARLGLSSTHPLISPRILKIINNVKATNFLPIYEKLPCEAQVLSANEISSSSDVGKTLETLTELADFIGDLDVSDEQARYNLNRFLVSQKYTLEEKVDLLRPYEESGRGVKHALLRRFQFCINSGHDLQKLIEAGDFISRKPEWLAEIMLHDGDVYSYEKNIPQMQDYSPEEVAFTILHGLEKVKGSTGVLSRLSHSDLTTRLSVLNSVRHYDLSDEKKDVLVKVLEQAKEVLEAYQVDTLTTPVIGYNNQPQSIFVNRAQQGIIYRLIEHIDRGEHKEAERIIGIYSDAVQEGMQLLESAPTEHAVEVAKALPDFHEKNIDFTKLLELFQSGYICEAMDVLGEFNAYVNSDASPEEKITRLKLYDNILHDETDFTERAVKLERLLNSESLLEKIKHLSPESQFEILRSKDIEQVIDDALPVFEAYDKQRYTYTRQQGLGIRTLRANKHINIINTRLQFVPSEATFIEYLKFDESFDACDVDKQKVLEAYKAAIPLLDATSNLYGQNKNFLFMVVPELYALGVDFEKLGEMYDAGYNNEELHKNRTIIDIVNSDMVPARKVEVANILSNLEQKWTIADVDSINSLLDAGVLPTSYLLNALDQTDDRSGTIRDWQSTMNSFSKGNFDPENELHRNLEYTRFRAMVNHEKLKKHIKNHFTFADYLKIFEKDASEKDPFTEQDRFEIECVAHEATLLTEYVRRIKAIAEEQGRDVTVIPNLSYGYLPFSPLVDELAEEGIDTIVGAKVGSTESHNNKEVLNSRLFKGNRTKLMKKQPVILIVDGTKHLVARDNNHKDARYPDAHQGYLNQAIAMNDAMGHTNIDYSQVGKSEEDMERLRQSDEFQRLVGVYQHVMRENTDGKEAYTFGLWNTAGKELLIRNYHEAIRKVKPYEAESIQGPAMIFCNIGVLDEQVPQQIKDEYPGLEHTPAYYDDSGKIINFDFGHDEHGVRYLNRLETEVKKAYQRMKGKEFKAGTEIPALIGYVNMQQSTGYKEEVA